MTGKKSWLPPLPHRVRNINLHFTYLLTYLLTYLQRCGGVLSAFRPRMFTQGTWRQCDTYSFVEGLWRPV